LRDVCLVGAGVLVNAYKDDLKNSAKNAYASHTDLISKYNGFVDNLLQSRSAAVALRDSVDSLVARTSNINKSVHPEDYLQGILVQLKALQSVQTQLVPALISSVAKTTKAMNDFVIATTGVKDLDSTSVDFQETQNAIQQIHGADFANNVIEVLQSKMSIIGTFLSSRTALAAVTKQSKEVKAYSGLLVADGSYIQKPLTQLIPTNINIATLGVDEGTTIQLTLQVYDADSPDSLLYEQDQFFRVWKFGVSSAVSAGLVFINAIDKPYSGSIRNEPTAAVVYLFRLRPCRVEYDYISFGFHAVTLNFDQNAPIEIGMGLSLHFFNDILQTGYGWNLHAPGNPKYWYVGLGVLGLLNSAKSLTF